MFSFIKKRYHWVIAGLMLLELAIYSGILNNLLSLHTIPVTESLGISRGSFSLGLSVRSFVGFFSTLLSGLFFLKHGYRKLAPVALTVAAVGFVILSVSQNLAMLVIGAAVLGLGEGFCSTAAASRMVSAWFHSRQGLILGLVTASTGLGGSLFSMVLSRVIETSGWRMGYLISGAFALVVVLIASVFIIRFRPEEMGLQPLGEEDAEVKRVSPQQITQLPEPQRKRRLLMMLAAAARNNIKAPILFEVNASTA